MKRLLFCLVVCAAGSASGAPPLMEVLRSTGKAVEVFWEQFSAINCSEHISQNKLGKEGKVIYRRDSAFDYLVLMRKTTENLAVEESRLRLGQERKNERVPLLVTNGFSTFLFIFHPYFQHSFEYSQPVEDELEDKKVLRVSFRQVRGARSPSCLRLRGRDYPLEWSGVAWIESKTGSVLRITAGLRSSMEDLGLKALSAEVSYSPVRFGDTPQEQWLPSVATIEARTAKQHWRNTHRFTEYKRFTVETSSTTEAPK